MTKVQITAEMQNLIDILKTPFLIVNEGKVADVFSSKELARAAKTEDGVAGKIVDGLKCEFEIVVAELAEELPDETISEEDEAELAAALDAEEAVSQTTIDAAAGEFPIDWMSATVCPECGSTELYTGRNKDGLVVDEEYIIGCHHCDWEVDTRKAPKTSGVRAKSPTQSATMKTSMKLDRTISCVGTGEVWKNANQMWKANPNWMTSAQQDGLTKKLYSAAKNGEKITVEINARHFTLVNV